jgi:integrase
VSALRDQLADYLRIRRSLGYKLERAEKLLEQFLAYLEERGGEIVTLAEALAWARLPGGSPDWWAFRLSAVRGFAAYLHALDPAHEVPGADLLPRRPPRAIPYLYSEAEVEALLAATCGLRGALRQATYRTLLGLLWVTGMRAGEAIRLDRDDVDLAGGVLTVRDSKFGKSRLLPLHRSTVTVLRRYLRQRERHRAAEVSDALFISPAGTRLLYCNLHATFRRLRSDAGLQARSARCRPRIHDIRHAFAVRTLLDWYRNDEDVQARLPLLSTYLGHAHPKDTYWYLSAAPELLTLAGQRLERSLGGRP